MKRKFKVLYFFTRIHPKLMRQENSDWWIEVWAEDKDAAKKLAGAEFRESNPTRRRIHKVEVQEL